MIEYVFFHIFAFFGQTHPIIMLKEHWCLLASNFTPTAGSWLNVVGKCVIYKLGLQYPTLTRLLQAMFSDLPSHSHLRNYHVHLFSYISTRSCFPPSPENIVFDRFKFVASHFHLHIDGLGHKPFKSGQAFFFRTMIKTIKHIGHKTSISVGRLEAAQNVYLSRPETCCFRT